MPSPTDKTWPTSVTSASVPKFWICCLRIAEISAARMSISGPHFLNAGLMFGEGGRRWQGPSTDLAHRQSNRVESGAQAGVDHPAAHLNDHAADKVRVDLHVDVHLGV